MASPYARVLGRWSPAQLAQTIALWESDSLVTTVGGNISQWLDEKAAYAFIAAGGSRPAYSASGGPNNAPYMVGGTHSLQCTGFPAMNQPFSYFCWLQGTTAPGGTAGIVDFGATNLHGCTYFNGATTNLNLYNSGTSGASPAGAIVSGRSEVFEAQFNGASSAILQNGNLAGQTGGNFTAINGTATGGGIQLAALYGGSVPGPANYLALLVLNTILPQGSPIRQSILQWGAQKYGGPQFVGDGNSIMNGAYASPAADSFFNLMVAAQPLWVNQNNGKSGYTTPQVTAYSAIWTDPLFNAYRPNNVLFFLEVLNDYTSGSSVSQCIQHMITYCQQKHAIGWRPVIGITPPPYNPLVGAPSGFLESDRQLIIAAMKSGVCGFDGIADAGSDPNWLTGSGATLATNPLYYSNMDSPEKHPNNLGHALIESYTAPFL